VEGHIEKGYENRETLLDFLRKARGPRRRLGRREGDDVVSAVLWPRREGKHEPVRQPMAVRRRCTGGGVDGVGWVMQNEVETTPMPTHEELMPAV